VADVEGMRWCRTLGHLFAVPSQVEGSGTGRALMPWLRRALVGVLLLYAATTLPGVRPRSGYDPLIDGWLQNGVLVAACLLIFLRVWSVRVDRDQPKIDLQTCEVEGVEALCRWQHPERGLLFPDSFIPEAERYGLMRSL
jgi:hypothetical protein